MSFKLTWHVCYTHLVELGW